MRTPISVLLMILAFASNSFLHAQDEAPLLYGESVRGTITDRNFEIEYAFEAEAGDVVAIQMVPVNTDEFRYPGILLLNAEYDVVAEAFESYSVTLFHDVLDGGSYYVLATRNDGRSGEGKGDFDLTLNHIPLMKNGQDLCESATSESDKYYAVRADGDFDISYQFIDGDFRPEISINTIKSRGDGLEDHITLTGPSVDRGILGSTIQSNTSQLLIVRVGQRTWDWSSDKNASYRVRLNLGEPSESIETNIVATTSINIRSGPGTQYDITGNFQSGDRDVATGRNEDGSWLKIQSGWVFANLVEVCGDTLQLLPVTS